MISFETCGDGSGGDNGGGDGGQLSGAKAMTSFAFAVPPLVCAIDEAGKAISVMVPPSVDVTAMVAIFASEGVSVEVGTATQTSGTAANDFSNPVVYAAASPPIPIGASTWLSRGVPCRIFSRRRPLRCGQCAAATEQRCSL